MQSGEYLLISAERSGQRHVVALMYMSATANAVYQFQHGQKGVDLVAVRGQQFALMAPDPRLPEFPHVGVNAGQGEGVPDADDVKQCVAETCFAPPGHAVNRKGKRSRRESLIACCA